MNCPQCATLINDPQAVFCPRCGTRLPSPIASPALPVARMGPASGDIRLPPPPTMNERPLTDANRSSVAARSLQLVKIVTAALFGAAAFAWIMGVMLYLAALPEVIMHAVDNEIAAKAQGQTEISSDILNQTLNQIFAATWGWAFVGLVVGAGAGWYLTRPKAR